MAIFALIVFNPNSDEAGSVYSTHRSAAAAHKAHQRLGYPSDKWAYVAERRVDGSYPNTVEAIDMKLHGVGSA